MADLRLADFYYGAVLSWIVNKKVNAALIDSSQKRRKYEFTTDEKDFILITRYTTQNKNDTPGYMSWSFSNIDEEIYELLEDLHQGKNIFLALILIKKDLKNSEMALLNTENINDLINKRSITISRKKNQRSYRISIGRSRNNAYKIPCNQSFQD